MLLLASLFLLVTYYLVNGTKVRIETLNVEGKAMRRRSPMQQFNEALLQDKEEYAALHGYSLNVGRTNYFPQTSVCWSKFIDNLKSMDEGYDLILNVDLDTKIMNKTVRIEDIDAYATNLCGDYSVAMAKDKLGFNAGVYLLKRSPEAYEILNEALKLIDDAEVRRQRLFEQSAFGIVVKSNERLAAKVCVVPQSLFNSYPDIEAYAGTAYKPGDFILHFVHTGKKVMKNYFS